jgi:hypothetical protein
MQSVIGFPEVGAVVAIVAMLLVMVWPAGKICSRLGFSPLLGVLAALPFANLLLLWFVALAPWPNGETGPRSI